MTPQETQQAAEDLAAFALGARHPNMTAAALIKHRYGHLRASQRAELRQTTYRLIRERLAEDSKARAPGPEWVTLDEAATLLGVTTKWLRRALIWPQFRRSLGWPRCLDGHQMWRFPRAALDSGTSHAFGSTIPDREPLHGLPPGHRRQDEMDMAVWPSDLEMPST